METLWKWWCLFHVQMIIHQHQDLWLVPCTMSCNSVLSNLRWIAARIFEETFIVGSHMICLNVCHTGLVHYWLIGIGYWCMTRLAVCEAFPNRWLAVNTGKHGHLRLQIYATVYEIFGGPRYCSGPRHRLIYLWHLHKQLSRFGQLTVFLWSSPTVQSSVSCAGTPVDSRDLLFFMSVRQIARLLKILTSDRPATFCYSACFSFSFSSPSYVSFPPYITLDGKLTKVQISVCLTSFSFLPPFFSLNVPLSSGVSRWHCCYKQ